jgi:hypothetical protein
LAATRASLEHLKVQRPGGAGKRGRRTTKALTVPIGLAALVAVLGGVVLVKSLLSPPQALHQHPGAPVYQAAGMEVRVENWAWMSHDMFGGPPPAQNNFPMPASMMPGLQAEDVNRLRVELTMTNHRDKAAELSRNDFRVESPKGAHWDVNDGMLATANVLPQSSLSVTLYFDVPLNETIKDLLYANGGGDSVQVPFTGPAPQHEHGY